MNERSSVSSAASVRESATGYELLHANGVRRLAVLLHDADGGPGRRSTLSRTLFAMGWNVLVPELDYGTFLSSSVAPRERDRSLLAALESVCLRAEALSAEYTLAGFSLGATPAMRFAARRRVTRIVAIAPLLGYRFWSFTLQRSAGRLLRLMAKLSGGRAGSLARVAATMDYGAVFVHELWRKAPETARLVVTLNINDPVANNAAAREAGDAWAAHRRGTVELRELRNLPLTHDILTTGRTNAATVRGALGSLVAVFDELT